MNGSYVSMEIATLMAENFEKLIIPSRLPEPEPDRPGILSGSQVHNQNQNKGGI